MNGTPWAKALGRLHTGPERAQPRGVPQLERLERRVDRLGALEMQDPDRRPVVVAGRVEVGGGPGEADMAVALEREQPAGRGCGVGRRDRWSTGRPARTQSRHRRAGPVVVLVRGRVKMAKIPPRMPPSRIRGRSRWPPARPSAKPRGPRGERVVVAVEITGSIPAPAPGWHLESAPPWTTRGRIRRARAGPCIVQDWRTGEVLTLAYMNAEALRPHPGDRRDALLQPLAPGAVAQGRHVRQHPGGQGDPLRLRRRRPAGAGRARRAGLPHRRADVLSPWRARAAGAIRGAADARAHDRRRAHARPDGSYTAALLADPARAGEKVQEEAEEVVRAAREESDERVAEEAADVLYHLAVLLGAATCRSPTPSGCWMAVASADADRPRRPTPSLERCASSRATTT